MKWVAENDAELELDRHRMAVAGNSVGGNMTLAAALLAKRWHTPALRALVLLWPVTSASSDWRSYALYGEERFLTAPLMRWMFDQYTDDPKAREEILLSPVNASPEELSGLPPTLIAVAENDILRDQGEAMGAVSTRRASRRPPCGSTASSTTGGCSTASHNWLPRAI